MNGQTIATVPGAASCFSIDKLEIFRNYQYIPALQCRAPPEKALERMKGGKQQASICTANQLQL
jgi:hypothetical protein